MLIDQMEVEEVAMEAVRAEVMEEAVVVVC